MEKKIIDRFYDAAVRMCNEDLNSLFQECAPKTLLKFFSAFDERRIASIKDGTLWMSNPANFNDPLDCAFNIDTKTLSHQIVMNENQELFSYVSIEKALKNNNRLRLQLKAKEDKTNIGLQENLSKIKKRLLVTCLCEPEKLQSLSMWAYYGGNHKGFCAEYETSAMHCMLLDCFFLPVKYTNQYPIVAVSNLYSKKAMALTIIDLLFSKSEDWSNEKEWRIASVFPSETNGAILTLIQPKRVYFGACAASEDIERIRTACDGLPIEFFQMQTTRDKFEIQPMKI